MTPFFSWWEVNNLIASLRSLSSTTPHNPTNGIVPRRLLASLPGKTGQTEMEKIALGNLFELVKKYESRGTFVIKEKRGQKRGHKKGVKSAVDLFPEILK